MDNFLDTSSHHLIVVVIRAGMGAEKRPSTRAATILRLLGNETIQFNTRGKKSEPGLQKQLNIDIKSTAKLILFFKYMLIIYIFY